MGHEFKNGDKVTIFGSHKPYYYVGRCPAREGCHFVVSIFDSNRTVIANDIELRLYKEPVKVSGWLNVCEGHGERPFYSNGIFATREQATQESLLKRIACVYVTGTEGEEP